MKLKVPEIIVFRMYRDYIPAQNQLTVIELPDVTARRGLSERSSPVTFGPPPAVRV
jgi:hypothetical protein